MNILVVGGAGFIGSEIAKQCVDRGFSVTTMDLKQSKVPGTESIIKDTTDSDIPNLDLSKYNIIIMLAASTNQVEFQKDAVKAFSTNVIGLLNVLEAARKSNVRKVAFASSSAVYGNINEIANEDLPIYPDKANMYSTSKIMGEHLFNNYIKNGFFDGVAMRYFNTYGVGENDKGDYKSIVSIFLEEIKKKGTATVYGDGEQKRDMIHVKDTARISIELALNHSGTFNVGTGESTSWNTILDILEKNGLKFERKYIKNPINDYQKFTQADTAKLSKLGLKTNITIEEGVKELIDYYSSS
jgi:UDP-glucose 4-epimerase